MATEVREEEKVLEFMDEIQKIISHTIQENNLSKEEIEKTLDYKRR
ncbi:hypothetical protein [Rossellomorea sp. BNER]|nr:hypothetical protein [Rossellomorea sp. BNER]